MKYLPEIILVGFCLFVLVIFVKMSTPLSEAEIKRMRERGPDEPQAFEFILLLAAATFALMAVAAVW